MKEKGEKMRTELCRVPVHLAHGKDVLLCAAVQSARQTKVDKSKKWWPMRSVGIEPGAAG